VLEHCEGIDHLLQSRPLLAQRLGTFRVIPDIGVFQLAANLDQLLTLVIVVKDTS